MNNLKSYTEYAVSTPTTDFVIGFDFNYGTDAVNVTVDDVPALEAGYSVIYLNSTTMRLSPAVPTGVVRLQRETDIDVPDNQFTAGAKFIASNMDENFTQIRHAQQEVRDGFGKLSDDTYEIIDTLQVVGQAAQDAADAAEQAAMTANDAAEQVNDKVSQDQLDYIHVNGAALPYKDGIVYEENAVVVKDGVLQQRKGGVWALVVDFTVSSVAELRTKVGKLGQVAQTLAYYVDVEGGGANYKWVGGTEDNGFDKINGWELIFTGKIDVRVGGLKVNLPTPEHQTFLYWTVAQFVQSQGGGRVVFPAGTFYGSFHGYTGVEMIGKINIDMTPATILKTAWAVVGNDRANLYMAQPFCKAKNFELDGSFNGLAGGIAGLRVTSYGCEFENIVSHSSRYDALAISTNAANFNTFTKCVFRHCKRNVVSYTAGHDNTFIDCQFIEDINVWGEALYLFDIEPNDSNGIWYNVTFKSCVFERVTQTANGAVFFEQKEVNPQRQLNITFDDCHFKGYAVIQPRGPYNIKGFKLINSRFDHIAFASAGASFYNIESGEIRGNSFSTQLLSYRINILGDVILSDNHFRGVLSPQVTDTATFRKNTFTGVTAIAPINRTSGIGTAAGRNIGEADNAHIPTNSLIRKAFGLRSVDRRTLTDFDYNTLTAGEYVLHQASTGQVNPPPYAYANLYVQNGYSNNSVVFGQAQAHGGIVTRGNQAGTWSAWALHYHTLNTTVDANGFIKAASPIVRMFADGIEVNEEAALQDIIFEKLGVGNYLLKGSTGFAQEGWYVETPKDANGNVLFSVVYTTLENGDISVKTYKKKFDLELAAIVADLNNPVDITENRWIDLRLQELPSNTD